MPACYPVENWSWAVPEITRALQIEEPLAAADPANAEAQQDLSFAYYMAGRVAQARGEFEFAAAQYRRCLAILEPLIRRHPGNVETAIDLERAQKRLAETEAASRQPRVP